MYLTGAALDKVLNGIIFIVDLFNSIVDSPFLHIFFLVFWLHVLIWLLYDGNLLSVSLVNSKQKFLYNKSYLFSFFNIIVKLFFIKKNKAKKYNAVLLSVYIVENSLMVKL